MARHPVLPPKKTRSKRPIVVVDKSNLPPQSLEKTVEELKLQADALTMSAQGMNHREIADELDIGITRVPQLIADGLGELTEKRDAAVDKFFAIHRRRYDMLIREWMPKAMDRTIQLKNEDGALVDHFIPADPKAAAIVAKLQADYAKMFGLTKMRVEHTGAGGGPIMNVNVGAIDWMNATNEQLAQVQAGNAEVLLQLSERSGAGASSSDAGDASPPAAQRRSSSRRH